MADNVLATRRRAIGSMCRRPEFGTPVLNPPQILACPNRPKGEGQDRGSGVARPERVSQLLGAVFYFGRLIILINVFITINHF